MPRARARAPLSAPPEERPVAALAAVRAGRAGQLSELEQAAAGCRACDLWSRATQTVFGAGPVPARIMLVGEQPGDREDIAGEPFVGPAGGILAKGLDAVGIDRETTFVTNVVKHFKWRPTPGGKRRLHEKPNKVEVAACLPWLESELALVRPEALVLPRPPRWRAPRCRCCATAAGPWTSPLRRWSLRPSTPRRSFGPAAAGRRRTPRSWATFVRSPAGWSAGPPRSLTRVARAAMAAYHPGNSPRRPTDQRPS
jgi:hypothetical protein